MPTVKKPKAKPDPLKSSTPVLAGSALWCVRQLAPLKKGFDVRGPEGGDLLAVCVRMSEADRKRLVALLT